MALDPAGFSKAKMMNKSKYDWSKIPTKYNYAATTALGAVFAYVVPPQKRETYWRAKFGGAHKVQDEPMPLSVYEGWETSLEERPGWEAHLEAKEAEI